MPGVPALGSFSEDGREYVLSTPHTPHRDWFNYLWNDRYLACVGPSLNGFSLYQNEAGTVTNLFGRQDQREEPRALYVRDAQDGAVWSAGYLPCATEHDRYECRHGLGYSILTTRHRDIEVALRVFVPTRLHGEIWTVTVTNSSRRVRKLDVFASVPVMLDGVNLPYGLLSGLSAEYRPGGGYLFFRNTTHTVAREKYRAFMYSTRRPTGWETSRDTFLGRARNTACPPGVEAGALTQSAAAAEYLSGTLQHAVRLAPGASWTVHIVLGVAMDEAEVRRALRSHGSPARIERAFTSMVRTNVARLGRLQVQTPDGDFNRLFSVWLKHQLYLMADWARFYFKGFRDTCQDAAGLSVLDPARATQLLHRALHHQRADGYAPRAFRVPSPGVAAADKQYADSAAWISHTTDALLRETGDRTLLDAVVPFVDHGSGTVWEHNLRALEFLWADRGRHGLSLMHHGDWNDLMDGVGARGRGESVWMSLALARALRLVGEMAVWSGDQTAARRCRQRFSILQKAILKHGWDGGHFIYAINDAGQRIGARRAREGRVFLNPQSWAMLSGVVDVETYRAIARRVEPVLESPVGPMHHWPPFTCFQEGIGQLSGTPAGFFTNGNVYCHAATFKVAADLAAGRGEKAFETLCRILPSAEKSEPFAQANGYVGPTAARACRHVSDDPWRTGTVAWHYLNVIDGLLGFHREYDGVRLAPHLPKRWAKVRLVRPFRGRIFTCDLVRAKTFRVWVDGVPVPDAFVAVPPGPVSKRNVQVRCEAPHEA